MNARRAASSSAPILAKSPTPGRLPHRTADPDDLSQPDEFDSGWSRCEASYSLPAIEDLAVEAFSLTYEGFDPDQEGRREVLTSTGNGRFCSRGAAEWEAADAVHYPGTYAHGVYNRETTILGGVPVLNEDLVNLPNWLVLKLRIAGADAVRLADVELLDYRHEYDLRQALMTRLLRFRDADGREATLRSRRFVSMAHPHRAGIEWVLTAHNWSGPVEVISAIDGRVTNRGVARYQQLEGRHLDPVSPRTFGPEVIALKVQTRQSNVYVSEAARTRVFAGERPLAVERSLFQTEDYVQQALAFELPRDTPVRVEKMVALAISHDAATSDTLPKAGAAALRRPDFNAALKRHARAWQELWRLCDIQVRGEARVQALLRLHISHILQVCSGHTADLDAGVPARGLNGEAYRGHVFWDELYVYPFLGLRLPATTRALLLYRYRRLEEARAAAEEAGFAGAMFPWQSGSEGTEETQRVHLNPLSDRWEPDLSRNQRHVNAAIFYNLWHYFKATRDQTFLRDYGAEMMLEIARFWAYEIHGVMGPDEFHEKYPGAEEAGLRNNAYTNVMVAWLCGLAGEVLSLLPGSRADALRARLDISGEELERWEDMSRRMFVPFHGDGIISQFEGYERLDELDWESYRQRYGNIQRLDRILRAEGDDPNRYKLSKQADVVMLFYLFSAQALRRLFERLGYDYGDDTAARNIAYYDERTSHGSTLSFVTHAGALASLDPQGSWQRFLVALKSDAEDVQGGTTKEGIHMGVMSGTLDLMQRAYPGTELRDDVLCFQPRLPEAVEEVSFPMQFQRTPLRVTLNHESLTVTVHREGAGGAIRAAVGDEVRELRPGDSETFALAAARPAGAGKTRSEVSRGRL
jgi:trehalose/maltose hydrolase-like predicted phosphorylase